MDSMRDVLKRHLGRSLETLPPEDRLAAAWPVACGRAMADRGHIAGFENGTVRIVVENSVWLEQMRSMQGVLRAELAKIAGVKIKRIHFEVKSFRREKTP